MTEPVSDAEFVEEVTRRIRGWKQAYPLCIFPEPDFEKAAKILKEAGMTLDSISVSNMRHAVGKIGGMVEGACERLTAANEKLEKLDAEIAKLNLILYHRENGLSHSDLNKEILISQQAAELSELKEKQRRLLDIIQECASRRGYAESEECTMDIEQALKD